MIHLRFGNVTVNQFVNIVNAALTSDERNRLDELWAGAASVPADRFHIFDDPALVVSIGSDIRDEVVAILTRANSRREFAREVALVEAPLAVTS